MNGRMGLGGGVERLVYWGEGSVSFETQGSQIGGGNDTVGDDSGGGGL